MPAAERMAVSLKLHDRLWDDHAIEVPVMSFGTDILLRTASHVFNERSDYDRLIAVLPALINELRAQL